MKVTIPAGIDDRQIISLRGPGNASAYPPWSDAIEIFIPSSSYFLNMSKKLFRSL